jgi:NDP-sugar pyrophosphorylase family protein
MFGPSKFFDYQNFEHKDLFDKSENVWDIVKNLPQYISNLFESGTVVGNYAKNVYVGQNVVIDPTAKIIGPAIIGDNCIVDFGAYLRGNIIIGAGSKIGHASEIKNSVILEKTAIAHFNYVGDSVVGSSVNFGAGAKIANFRFDEKNIPIKHDGEKIDTGLGKFGAIVGDNSKIGVNAVLNPGTILGKDCLVFPLESVLGVYSDNSRIHSS